jgi:hypothetical protein
MIWGMVSLLFGIPDFSHAILGLAKVNPAAAIAHENAFPDAVGWGVAVTDYVFGY